MDNFPDDLMQKIFLKSDFSLAKGAFTDEEHAYQTSVYIGKKSKHDYFIYLHLPEKLLSNVINDIQIKLIAFIKHNFADFEQINDGEIEITSSFDKNATLIIFASLEGEINNTISNQAISIEEDPYFFKKQLLLISKDEVQVASNSFNTHIDDYVTYLQKLIADTDRFDAFTHSNKEKRSNEEIEYSFVAKLYEKLPFLTLLVERSDKEVLQQTIDNKLSPEQLSECEKLLALDVDDLDDWFNEIVKEEIDD